MPPMLPDPSLDAKLHRWRELERLLEEAQRLLLAREWRAFLVMIAQLSALAETIEATMADSGSRCKDLDLALCRIAHQARVLRALLARTCHAAHISSNLLASAIGAYPARTGG